MKRCRRVISHHGSDCPEGPHNFREHRCLILTRIDRPGQKSEAWVSGDCAETMPLRCKDYEGAIGERLYRKRHTFDPRLPTWYGGGFWERVAIGPAEGVEPAGVASATDRAPMGRRYRR